MHKLAIAVLLIVTFVPAQTKRPMTFEDMMHMKRLGSTAVSPDGRWLGYSVTTVDLDKNTKTPELFIQPIDPANTKPPTAIGQPGDSGLEFASDNKHVLFLSGREGGQQIWLADFDSGTGTTANPRKLTALSTEADNAKWSPDSKSIVFTSSVYPDCPAITVADSKTGDQCNADKDARADSTKVKAQIFTTLMYRHWNHYIGEKRSHLFLVSVDGSGMRDLTPNDPHDVPPDYPTDPLGCGCAFSPDSKELALVMKEVPDEADQHQLRHLHPRPHRSQRKAGEGEHRAWRRLLARLLARRQIPRMAFPGPRRIRE